MITPFVADLDDERLKRLSFNLMNAPFVLSDELRNYDRIWKMLIRDRNANIRSWELEPWLGMVVLREVVPNHRAKLDCWIWDKTIYESPEFLEEMPGFFQAVMSDLQVYRLAIETPQEELVNWLKNFGFKVEGRQKYGFKWNDRMVTQYMVRKIKEL